MAEYLKKAILDIIQPYHGVRIALSGGIDSVALLNLCWELRNEKLITYFDAIYVNHLTPYSDEAEVFCRSLCARLDIDLTVLRLNTPALKNKEAFWREQRYRHISDHTPLMTHVLLGHHENDQAETFLINTLRGTGLNGLTGMSTIKTAHKKIYKRPFLNIKRQMLSAYILDRQLTWLEDPSNKDNSYKRNFIRNEIMPLLHSKWPAASSTIARTAQNLLNDHALNQKINAFRQWLQSFNIQLDKIHATDLFLSLYNAPFDRTICISFAKYDLYKHHTSLYLVINNQTFANIELSNINLFTLSHIKINDYCSLSIKKVDYGLGIDEKYIKDISIRARVGGEKIQLSSKQPRQKIKKLLQSFQLPIYLKKNTPLIYYKDEVIGIPGFIISQAFCSQKHAFQINLIIKESSKNNICIAKNMSLLKKHQALAL